MPPALRYTLAFLAGFTATMVLIGSIEALGHLIIPPPKEATAAAVIGKTSLAGFAFVLVAHMLGSLSGIVVAGLISKGRPLLWALLMGGLVLAGSVVAFSMWPIPPLIAAADFALEGLAIWLGYRFLRSRETA